MIRHLLVYSQTQCWLLPCWAPERTDLWKPDTLVLEEPGGMPGGWLKAERRPWVFLPLSLPWAVSPAKAVASEPSLPCPNSSFCGLNSCLPELCFSCSGNSAPTHFPSSPRDRSDFLRFLVSFFHFPLCSFIASSIFVTKSLQSRLFI